MKELVGQFKKLVDLHLDGQWHCRAEWWVITKSPHKRRDDLAAKGYTFEERSCTHGITNSKDFRLLNAPPKVLYQTADKILINGEWVAK